jgi:hypothetical protein
MTPDTGLSANTLVTGVIFLFTVTLLTACGQGEKPVIQEVEAETAVAPLVVKDWYPSPKHPPGLPGGFSSLQNQQSRQFDAQSASQAFTGSQPWAVATDAQQPAVIVFQDQEYVLAQPQQRWSYQQPVTRPAQAGHPLQQSYAVPESQYVQRPWGNATFAEDHSQSNASLESWPPGNNYAPARMPAAGGYPANNSGQYWTVPPANYYGNVWQYP